MADRTSIRGGISSITKGPRQTNIELLRILAMFMVLVVHADFVALGEPSWTSIVGNPVVEGGRSLIEIAAKVCVNVFILISGWFGIKPSIRGFLGFTFQCLYFYFPQGKTRQTACILHTYGSCNCRCVISDDC